MNTRHLTSDGSNRGRSFPHFLIKLWCEWNWSMCSVERYSNWHLRWNRADRLQKPAKIQGEFWYILEEYGRYVLSSNRLAYRAIKIFQSFLKAGLQSIFLLYRSKSRASRADRYESSTATKSWWPVPHAAGQALDSSKMTDWILPTSLKSIPCSGPYHPDHSPMSTITPFWMNWT